MADAIFDNVSLLDDEDASSSDRVMEQRAAALAYQAAFDARLAANLRRCANGFIIDDQAEDARLASNLAHAARRWARALIALGCPLPPGLLAEVQGTQRV